MSDSPYQSPQSDVGRTSSLLGDMKLNCPAARILQIQPQIGAILFKPENQDWHRLGSPGDQGVSEMYSALLAAMMADKKVVVRYPEGYDCSAYNTEISAQMVRVYRD